MQVADPVVGAERLDVVAELARRVGGVHQDPDVGSGGRGADGGGHGRDRDDGGGRRGNPVDHDQPCPRRAGARVGSRDVVVGGADREDRLDDPRPGPGGVVVECLADRAVAVVADHQLVAGRELERAEDGRYALGDVAHPRRPARVEAEESGRALARRRDQPGDLDSVEPVRVALGPIAPRGGGPPHGDRGDAERAVVEVQDVGVEAERLKEGRVHNVDCVIQAGKPELPESPGTVRNSKAFIPNGPGRLPAAWLRPRPTWRRAGGSRSRPSGSWWR